MTKAEHVFRQSEIADIFSEAVLKMKLSGISLYDENGLAIISCLKNRKSEEILSVLSCLFLKIDDLIKNVKKSFLTYHTNDYQVALLKKKYNHFILILALLSNPKLNLEELRDDFEKLLNKIALILLKERDMFFFVDQK